MKSDNLKHIIFGSLICVATIGLFLLFSGQLPDRIPVQVNIFGNVSRTMAKPLFIFGFPIFFALVNLY